MSKTHAQSALTKQDAWLAVYRDTLKVQRREHPFYDEVEWATEAKQAANAAADAFDQKFPVEDSDPCPCEQCRSLRG